MFKGFRFAQIVFVLFVLAACSDEQRVDEKGAGQHTEVGVDEANVEIPIANLTVYKTPSCGCCGAWVDHIQTSGFSADVVNQDTVAHVKDHYGIPTDARSCHTAVSDDEYVFEGHVPAKYMQRFLASPPEGAKGLIVPAMPLGSPGMEYKDQFNPYQIFVMKTDGKMEVYASIASYEQQF